MRGRRVVEFAVVLGHVQGSHDPKKPPKKIPTGLLNLQKQQIHEKKKKKEKRQFLPHFCGIAKKKKKKLTCSTLSLKCPVGLCPKGRFSPVEEDVVELHEVPLPGPPLRLEREPDPHLPLPGGRRPVGRRHAGGPPALQAEREEQLRAVERLVERERERDGALLWRIS